MPESTFKQRVRRFWEWFSRHHHRFFQSIAAGNSASLSGEFREAVDALLPGFTWEFGVGEDDGHAFTLSGEGDLNKQFLTSYWQRSAPELEGWTFHSTRQPCLGGLLTMGDVEIDPDRLQVVPTIDTDHEVLHIEAWHPVFDTCETDDRFSMLFVLLDQTLGETGTSTWLGNVEIQPLTEPASAIPLSHLPAFVESVRVENQWEKSEPVDTYQVYEMNEPSEEFPRADTIAGTTCNMRLVGEYLAGHGTMADPIEGTGAEFVYLRLNLDLFPGDNQVERRADVEDTLDAALAETGSGRVFGGAVGFKAIYIDIVLFDGDESVAILDNALRRMDFGDGYALVPFASAE